MEIFFMALEKEQNNTKNMFSLAETIGIAMESTENNVNVGAIYILADLLRIHTEKLESLLEMWKERNI